MSYIKKSAPAPLVNPRLLPDQPMCEQHGFPLLQINGQWECVFEYLHDCVAHKQVVDVIQHLKTIYYVFEDGHQLPLLCGCCGNPLEVNVASEREAIAGRRLDQIFTSPVRLNTSELIDEMILIFSLKEGELEPWSVNVAFEVAAKLRHPADCSRQGLPLVKPTGSRPTRRSPHKRRRK